MFTFLAQMCGFASSIAIAHLLGANHSTDAYFLGLSVPMLVYGVFLAAVRQGAIPALTEQVAGSPEAFAKASSELVSTTIVATTMLSLVATGLAIGLLPLTIGNASLASSAQMNALELTPIGVFGATIAALAAILAVRNRFAAAAIVLAFDPLLRIVLLLVARSELGTGALVIANLAGNALAVAALWGLVRREGIVLKLRQPVRSPFVRGLLSASFPLLVGASVIQANPVVDRAMAGSLGSGSITALELGLRLFAVPMTLIGATLIGPLTATWSARKAAGGWTALRDSVNRAIEVFVMIVPPLLVLGIGLRHQLVGLMYHGGAYSAHATHETADVFALFLVGLPAQLLSIAFATLFVVEKRTVFMMKTGFVNVGLNVGLNFALRPALGVSGIALSTSLTYTLVLVLYLVATRRRWEGVSIPFWGTAGVRAGVGVGLMALAAYAMTSTFPAGATRAQLAAEVVAVGLAVVLVYGMVLLAADKRRRVVVDWVRQGVFRSMLAPQRGLAHVDRAEGS
jgi:putative peptidoglycan lipid II flippase